MRRSVRILEVLGRVSKLPKIVSILMIVCSLGGCDLWIVNPAFLLRTSAGNGSGANGEDILLITKDEIEAKIAGRHARDESWPWLIQRLLRKREVWFGLTIRNVGGSELSLSSPACTLVARATVHEGVLKRGEGGILPPEKYFEFRAEFSNIPNLDEDEQMLLKCTILDVEHNKSLSVEAHWVMTKLALLNRD